MSTITSSQEQQIIDEVPKQLYIGGEWRDGAEGALSVEDPATGQSLCEVADASVDDARAALDAAVEAGPEWAKHSPRERGEILRSAFEAIVARTDELALLMTLEMGKPLAESKAEIAYGAEFLRWFSEQTVRIDGRYAVAPNGQGRLLTMKQPVGPCLLITPWNFPLAMGTRKVGPAIAAGCTMVVKPAQQTPLSMLMLAKILEESGLPGGVLNLITASSASESTGPLIDENQREKVAHLVEDAVQKGAKALVGGHARDGSGYFYDPTVLTDVPDGAELLREEIFGPVAPVKGFTSEDEAIAAANDTEYG